MEEVAAHAALLIQQKDGDEAFAKRSEVCNLRSLVLYTKNHALSHG